MAPEPDVRGRVVLGFPQVFCEISVGSILCKITWKAVFAGDRGEDVYGISARDLCTRSLDKSLHRISE